MMKKEQQTSLLQLSVKRDDTDLTADDNVTSVDSAVDSMIPSSGNSMPYK